MKKVWRFIKKNPLLCFGLVLMIFLFLITVFGQYLPFVDKDLEEIPFEMENGELLIPPLEPSDKHILGTDRSGRDMLSLIIMGAKETLMVVILITIVRYVVAIPLSYLAHKNYVGADFVLKGSNQFLSYVPTIIIVVLLATFPPIMLTDNRAFYMIVIIALVEAGRAAEVIKKDFDEISTKEYILSGKAIGVKNIRLLKSYYLPFIYGKLIVYLITDLGKVMFLLGQLGLVEVFLSQSLVQIEIGLFELQNSSVAWPMMLTNAFLDIRGPIWIPFWAAFAMTFTIFTFYITAQGIQNMPKRKDSYI